MDWRKKAKELNIPLWHRKKVDVLKDIAAKTETVTEPEFIKVIISPKEATAICNKALFDVAMERGLGTLITCERWFVNCKRKGIVFKGRKNVSGQSGGNTEETAGESGDDSGIPEAVCPEGSGVSVGESE